MFPILPLALTGSALLAGVQLTKKPKPTLIKQLAPPPFAICGICPRPVRRQTDAGLANGAVWAQSRMASNLGAVNGLDHHALEVTTTS